MVLFVFAAKVKEDSVLEEEHAGSSARSTEQGTPSTARLVPPNSGHSNLHEELDGDASDGADSDEGEGEMGLENNLNADYGMKRGHDPQFIGNLPPISEADSGAESLQLHGTLHAPTPPSIVKITPPENSHSSSLNAAPPQLDQRPSSAKTPANAHFSAPSLGMSQPPTSTLGSKITQWMATANSLSPPGTNASQWSELANQLLGNQHPRYASDIIQTPPQPNHQMALVPQSEYDVTRPVSYTAKHVPQVAPPQFPLRKPSREDVDESPAFIDATLGKDLLCSVICTACPESLDARCMTGWSSSVGVPPFCYYSFFHCNFGNEVSMASMIRLPCVPA